MLPAPRCARPLPSEPVVDTEPQDARLESVAGSGQHVTLVRQIDVEIFGLGRPVRGEADLKASARGPADMGAGLGEPVEFDLTAAEGKADRAVEQDVIERDAGASAHGAEPRIGK